MSTYIPSSHDISRKWFVLDASGQTLGRLATRAANMLSGKLSPKLTHEAGFYLKQRFSD